MKRSLKVTTFVLVVALCIVLAIMGGTRKSEAPVQPIEFSHWQHVKKQGGPELDCVFCHEHAGKGPYATIPNTSTCMACHEFMETDKPEVQKLAAFAEKKEQPPWVRVYWFEAEANAFFNHKPHVKAGVECAACHGEVGDMKRVRREVKHTMGWCIECHRARNVSIDCYVCHR
ncbi:MAG TPA: cytochrome c3 family protein [Blastocatellia bacterium]|nr:cytochrome c3 family protein [Blastocatellia bacterium]